MFCMGQNKVIIGEVEIFSWCNEDLRKKDRRKSMVGVKRTNKVFCNLKRKVAFLWSPCICADSKFDSDS